MNDTSAPSSPGNIAKWHEYIGTLDWGSGNRDDSGYKAFLRAGSLGVDPQVATEEVIKRIKATGGTITPSKLQSQQKRAYSHAGGQQGEVAPILRPPATSFDPAKLKEFVSKAPGIDAQWLKSRSPVSPEGINSAPFLEHLYLPGEKVLVFESLHSPGDHVFEIGAQNSPLPKLTADGVWYLVNPVDGQTHPNPRQDNKPSARSEESVTSWRYMVIESDVVAQNEWLSCLVQLHLQISAIYTSGGKSVHALVRVDAGSKEEWDAIRDQLRPLLVTLGADSAAMTGVRLSRLPGAYRGPCLQGLLYLNPHPKAEPIIQQFP